MIYTRTALLKQECSASVAHYIAASRAVCAATLNQVVLDALQRCRSRGNRTARPADGALQWLAVQRKEGMDGKREGGSEGGGKKGRKGGRQGGKQRGNGGGREGRRERERNGGMRCSFACVVALKRMSRLLQQWKFAACCAACSLRCSCVVSGARPCVPARWMAAPRAARPEYC